MAVRVEAGFSDASPLWTCLGESPLLVARGGGPGGSACATGAGSVGPLAFSVGAGGVGGVGGSSSWSPNAPCGQRFFGDSVADAFRSWWEHVRRDHPQAFND